MFTQYKSWIEFQVDGKQIGEYFERVDGGQVEYSLAEAAPANSGGRIYRATRFRIGELTLEGYLRKSSYLALLNLMATVHRNRNTKGRLSVAVVRRDGEATQGKLKELYLRCSVILPAQPEGADVGRDNDFVMMSLRVQPEAKIVYIDNQPVATYDSAAKLNDTSAYHNA